MKILNLVIYNQQLENSKIFQYNNNMKSKQELIDIAQKIIELESKYIKDKNEDIKSEITSIIQTLTFEEFLEVDELFLKNFFKNN